MSEPRHMYSPRIRVVAPGPTGQSLVQQQFKKMVDINNIMKRYENTGTVEHLSQAKQYFSEEAPRENDFFKAMTTVTRAEQAFEALPAQVRKRFGNDPLELLKFVHGGEKNYEEAHELGLLDEAKYLAYLKKKEAASKPASSGATPPPSTGKA